MWQEFPNYYRTGKLAVALVLTIMSLAFGLLVPSSGWGGGGKIFLGYEVTVRIPDPYSYYGVTVGLQTEKGF